MLHDFKNNILKYRRSILMPGGFYSNLPETLKTINSYWNSEFLSGKIDEKTKVRLYFYNVVKPAALNASKNIDIDLAEILPIPKRSGYDIQGAIISRELKHYLTENNFGELLNRIAYYWPKYGHLVLKIVDGAPYLVNIENLRMNPAAEFLEKSEFVYEYHRLTVDELLKKQKAGWNIEPLLKLGYQTHDILEAYEFDSDGKRIRSFYGFSWPQTKNFQNRSIETFILARGSDEYPPILLHQQEVDRLPYYELKWEPITGRWLGMGVPEDLLEEQIAENTSRNLSLKNLYLKTLILFLTADKELGSNLLAEKESGDVIITPNPIAPLQIPNQDLNALQLEDLRRDALVQRKAFLLDPAALQFLGRGRIGANTLNFLFQQKDTYFKQKRENLGMFLAKIILKEIIPSFKKKNNREHSLVIGNSVSDRLLFEKFIIGTYVDKFASAYFRKYGFYPTEEEIEEQKNKILKTFKNQKHKELTIPADFYEDVEYWLDIVITGENVDLSKIDGAITRAQQIIAQNPAILQNKALRNILFRSLEIQGVPPADLELFSDAADEIGEKELPQAAPIASLPKTGPTGMVSPEALKQLSAPLGQVGT